MSLSHSPDKMSRGIMSDSSDSDCGSDYLAITRSSAPRVPPHLNNTVSDNTDDIFDINYSGMSDFGVTEGRSRGKLGRAEAWWNGLWQRRAEKSLKVKEQ